MEKFRYDQDSFSTVIDTQKGHWPVSTVMSRNQPEQQITTDLKIAMIHHQWLPEAGTVSFPKERTELKFNWHSVNQSVAAMLDLKAIEERFSLVSVDQRPAN